MYLLIKNTLKYYSNIVLRIFLELRFNILLEMVI